MIKEHGMHRLAHPVITPEGERQVADAAAHLCIGQMSLDPFSRPYEVYCIVVVFLYPCCNCKDIGIENYIFRRKTGLINKQIIRSFGNCDPFSNVPA